MSDVVRPLALALVRRGHEVLVMEVYDAIKAERFYRLLGGGIEFGERAEDAVGRELREETGSDARVGRRLGVVENLGTFEGRRFHEIAFVFDAELMDARLYARNRFELTDVVRGETVRIPACWVDPERLDAPLYPDGVLELIANAP